jgi:hypothetical protein
VSRSAPGLRKYVAGPDPGPRGVGRRTSRSALMQERENVRNRSDGACERSRKRRGE